MNITLLKRALNQALSLGNKAFEPQFALFFGFSTFEITNRRNNGRDELPTPQGLPRGQALRRGRRSTRARHSEAT